MANTETTVTSAWAWRPDVQGIPARDAVPDALILKCSTVAGRVEGDKPTVRVPYVVDDTAGFVAEGDDINEDDPELSEAVVHTGKVAQLIRLSREQFEQENAAGLLSESVARAVTKAANIAFVRQAAPTPPALTPPAGLINIAGIEDGTSVEDDLDKLIDLQATLAGNGANPDHILMSPLAWANLRKYKTDSTSAVSLLGAGTADVEPRLLGIPVTITSALASNTGLMLDSNTIVSAVGDVQVAVDESVYFASDSVGIRCTWRFGQTAVHADRIGKFTVDAPSSQ